MIRLIAELSALAVIVSLLVYSFIELRRTSRQHRIIDKGLTELETMKALKPKEGPVVYVDRKTVNPDKIKWN